jgi:hypothetical protein
VISCFPKFAFTCNLYRYYTSVSAPSSSSSLAHVPYRDSKLARVLQVGLPLPGLPLPGLPGGVRLATWIILAIIYVRWYGGFLLQNNVREKCQPWPQEALGGAVQVVSS